MTQTTMEPGLKDQLIESFKAKTARIGIVGMGYVGLPLALRFAAQGFKVVGFDLDDIKVCKCNAARSYIKHISDASILEACKQGFEATTSFIKIAQMDAIIICVPTPLDSHREPDLSHITSTLKSMRRFLSPGQLVCLESTTYPGTTEEVVVPMLTEGDFDGQSPTVGEDLFVVFSPEREDPGNANFSTQTIPKVVGGITPACLEAGVALYSQVIDTVVPVSSTKAAELTKLLENIHRAVNIGLVNEMKIIADKMGIDIYEVIRAAATKPFGFVPYYPGPGLGGHCIPIDPFYLTWKAREYGVHTRFIELAGEVNASMPDYVVSKTTSALNDRQLSVKGANILVLGVAYKKDVDDARESPSLEIMRKLVALGAGVDYSDPFIPELRLSADSDLRASVDLDPITLGEYDCVVLATNHSAFDYDLILKNSWVIVDTRGVFKAAPNVARS